MRKLFSTGLSFLFLILLFGCDKGTPLPNQDPNTSIFLDKIELTGPDRLTSVVTVFWSGTDRDGFIQGFEISFDEQDWSFTSRYDTTFRFTLEQGKDTLDIDLYVRAIDDHGLKDPSPAFLRIPIKNTPPVVQLLDDFQPIDTSNTVFSLIWNTTDLDGDETLDSTFIKFNDGPWTPLDRNANAIRVIPEFPMGSGQMNARVLSSFTGAPTYTINFEQEESKLFQGLNLDGVNTVYVQVRDKAGAFSEPDTSLTFYLQKQTSDFLLIHSHVTGAEISNFYRDAFASRPGGYDYLDLFKNNADADIRFWNFNFRLILDLYDRTLWYSGKETFATGVLLLEIGMFPVVEYLNEGGKMLVSTYITGDLPSTSALFNLTPMDSISPKDGSSQARISSGEIAWPDSVNPNIQDFPDIVCSKSVLNAGPFYRNPQSRGFYKTEITPTGSWSGPDNIGAYFSNLDDNPNFFFFSVELHLFQGDVNNIYSMLNKVIDEEFNW